MTKHCICYIGFFRLDHGPASPRSGARSRNPASDAFFRSIPTPRYSGENLKPPFPEIKMNVYIFRHSKKFSSWSMMDEPHICSGNYITAEVSVLAESVEQALALLAEDKRWDMEELKKIEPETVPLDRPSIIGSSINTG